MQDRRWKASECWLTWASAAAKTRKARKICEVNLRGCIAGDDMVEDDPDMIASNEEEVRLASNRSLPEMQADPLNLDG